MKLMSSVKWISVAGGLLLSLGAHADWALDGEKSELGFISTKKNTVAEVHTFEALSGGVDKSGSLVMRIDLNSVETNIEIRNQRMKQWLFETAKFPEAVVRASVDYKALVAMAAGEQTALNSPLTLELHGEKKAMQAKLLVTKLASGQIQVSSAQPVLLKAGDFKLLAGVEKLRELAGLPSISPAVPVFFTLVLSQE